MIVGKFDCLARFCWMPFSRFSWEYWFFTMNVFLYLLITFINVGLNKMSKQMHGALVGIILLFFYIEPLFSSVFYQNSIAEGLSIIAFVTLYVIGAYLAKSNDIPKMVRSKSLSN